MSDTLSALLTQPPHWAREAVTHGLVYLAVQRYVASSAQYSLAVLHLTPPPLSEKPAPVPASADAPPKPVWRRCLPSKGAASLLCIYAAIFAVAFLLPKYADRQMLDAFWSVFELAILAVVFQGATTALFPVPSTLHLEYPPATIAKKQPDRFVVKRKSADPAGSRLPLWQRHGARFAFGCVCALASLGLSAVGVPVKIVLPAAWVLFFSNSITIQRLKLRMFVYFVVGYYLAIVVLTGGVVYLIAQFSSSNDKDDSPSTPKGATPSPWLTDLMTSANCIGGFLPVCLLLGMTHRWLLFETLIPSAAAASNAPVPVPSGRAPRIPSHAGRRIFRLCSVAYLAILACVVGLYYRAGGDNEAESAVNVVALIGAPLAFVAATAVVVVIHGRFKEWWAYEEDFVPALPTAETDIEKKEVDDVERALLADS